MIRHLAIVFVVGLIAGCGNKIDLPQETSVDKIPFKNYFVYAEWKNIGKVTDIVVTKAQWVYFAEDLATVKRYRRKGSNVEGQIVATQIKRLEGFRRPFKLDEGASDHLFVLDLIDTLRAATAKVRLYDILDEVVTTSWSDPYWSHLDSSWIARGVDFTMRRSTRLTSLAADDQDNVYVGGSRFSFAERVEAVRDTHFTEGGHEGEYDSITVVGFDTTYADTTLAWFVRAYDFLGSFLYEAVGTGTGDGYGADIHDVAIAGEFLVFIDAALEPDRVKISDPGSEHRGIDWLPRDNAAALGEPDSFDLDPGGLAGDPSGFIYICDTGNGRILKYDRSLGFVTRVDENDPGIALFPTAVGVTDTLVYVYDEGGEKVVLFEFPKTDE